MAQMLPSQEAAPIKEPCVALTQVTPRTPRLARWSKATCDAG